MWVLVTCQGHFHIWTVRPGVEPPTFRLTDDCRWTTAAPIMDPMYLMCFLVRLICWHASVFAFVACSGFQILYIILIYFNPFSHFSTLKKAFWPWGHQAIKSFCCNCSSCDHSLRCETEQDSYCHMFFSQNSAHICNRRQVRIYVITQV